MLLDLPAEARHSDHLLVAEDRLECLLLGEGACLRAAVGRVLDHELLVVDLATADRERGLLDDVAIGRDRARYDGLAESEGALDHELVALPRGGIDGEHHAGPGRRELELHDHGDVHLGLSEPIDAAVVDRACAEQRAPAAAHGVDYGVGAANVEEGLVHAREGGLGGVLAGSRGADRHRRVAVLAGESLVAFANRLLKLRRHGRPIEQLTCRRACCLQRRRVLDIERIQELGDALAQARLGAVGRIGRGADDEAVWHR